MDSVTKTIAKAHFKKEMDIFCENGHNAKYWTIYLAKNAIRFALTCHEQAKKDFHEYRLEKINEYLEKREIRKEKHAFSLSPEHIAAKKYIGCFVFPFENKQEKKTTGQISFLKSIIFKVVGIDVGYKKYGHNYGPYTEYACKVLSHPAKSFGGIHYRKNELVGVTYKFDHISENV